MHTWFVAIETEGNFKGALPWWAIMLFEGFLKLENLFQLINDSEVRNSIHQLLPHSLKSSQHAHYLYLAPESYHPLLLEGMTLTLFCGGELCCIRLMACGGTSFAKWCTQSSSLKTNWDRNSLYLRINSADCRMTCQFEVYYSVAESLGPTMVELHSWTAFWPDQCKSSLVICQAYQQCSGNKLPYHGPPSHRQHQRFFK